MLMAGGTLSIVGGLVLFIWALRATPEALASDRLKPRLGILGVRLLHLTFGLFGIALGVLLFLSGLNS